MGELCGWLFHSKQVIIQLIKYTCQQIQTAMQSTSTPPLYAAPLERSSSSTIGNLLANSIFWSLKIFDQRLNLKGFDGFDRRILGKRSIVGTCGRSQSTPKNISYLKKILKNQSNTPNGRCTARSEDASTPI